jgi:hypothetical protein
MIGMNESEESRSASLTYLMSAFVLREIARIGTREVTEPALVRLLVEMEG